MKKKSAEPRESITLSGMLPGSDLLAPLWQVIYYEAIRSNHILFDAADLTQFVEDTAAQKKQYRSIKDDGSIERSFVQLLKCSNLTETRNYINQQPFAQRKQIFTMYLRYIDSLKANIKQSLN